MSATRNAFRNVLSTGLLLDRLAGPARAFDLLAGGLREAVSVDGERLAQVALAEHLDGHVAAGGEAGLAQRARSDLGAVVEAGVQIPQVHRLGAGAELLERHRLLHRRPAQLAHPHVDRVLPALEAHAPLVARARARALVAAARGLAGAGALAAADALALLARALGRLQGVQADVRHRTPRPDVELNESGPERSDGPPARRCGRSCPS